MSQKCPEHNADCKSSEHVEHLCYYVSQGFHFVNPEEYKWMVEDAKFVCKHCGRVAKCENHLCVPVKL